MKQLNETSENLKVSPSSIHLFDPIEELQLKVNRKDEEDVREITEILTTILTYPSTEMAELHMESNRLGTQDLRSEILERTKGSDNVQFCPCCGFVKQTESLKICTHLGEINNIGISTYLYFQTIKNLVVLLTVMSLGYSIYAIATNVKASDQYRSYAQSQNSTKLISTLSYVSLSLGSKQLNPTDENKTSYFIQCWIGLGVVIVWLLLFFGLKYSEKSQQTKVEQETISASDFTITMENVPKDITIKELADQFKKYEESITNVPAHWKKPFTIAKINVGTPFYLNQEDFKDDELDDLRQKHAKLLETFIEWIQERQKSATFSSTKEQRKKIYDEFKTVLQGQMKKYKQISDKIQQKIKNETKQETTTAFITFENGNAMKVISQLNDPSIASKIRYYLTCCQGRNKFRLHRGQEEIKVKIERAPEPEDILWSNLAVPTGEYAKRKIITYTVTFAMLGASFGIVYGLSKAQQSNTDNQALSLAISACISVVNIIISIVIQKLSAFEMEYTQTKYQTSLALKSIFAALINSILIPMMVNYYIKEDIYGKNGLASDVFMLGLTNSFVSPILKIVNISYIVNRISKHFASSPNSKLSSNQADLNNKFEYLAFEVGQQYVYLVSLFLFTCYFVSLQPIIAIFALFGMGLMYWSQKQCLFNKMQRPIPGTDLVNVTMFNLILLGGFFYTLGSLTWSNFMPNGIPKESLLPNLIALGVSILMFLMPYRAILALCSDEAVSANLVFSEKRIILSSEYDRLNPTTSAQALKEFQQYYVKKMSSASEEEKKKLMDLLSKQNARGQQKPNPQMNQNPFGGMFQTGPLLPPPPQMMFNAPPPHMYMNPGFMMRPQMGFMPQQPMYRPPGFQQPGFQQPIQQSGFQQPGFQQPPTGFQPQKNAFTPVVPMPGPTFVPQQQQQQGFVQPPPQNQGFGFQPPKQNQGFGFQAPPQNQGFGFQLNQMQANFGFNKPFGFG